MIKFDFKTQGSWGFDMRRNFSVEREAFGKYTTRLIGEEARQLITNHNPAIPMFLYIAHLAVHSANGYSPLQAPRETIEMFQYIKDVERRRFAGSFIDCCVLKCSRIGILQTSLSKKNAFSYGL